MMSKESFRKISYEFKLLSGDTIPISFTYISHNIDSFRLSFLKECRGIFPDILYDQLIIFDKENNIYNLDDINSLDNIKDNDYVFNIFINDKESVMNIFKKEIEYYEKWKGQDYRTYIINIQKEPLGNKLKITSVYCGAEKNILFSFFFDGVKDFKDRAKEPDDKWIFLNEKARYRYFFETGLIHL